MADANYPLTEVHFSKFITDTGLFDVLGSKHDMEIPQTYNWGTQKIDHTLGALDIIQAVRKCGILRSKDSINSNHRGLCLDIYILQEFGGDIY